MRLSPQTLKWVLRFYPPFFFQRIWVKKIHADFKQIDIRIPKSWLNTNSNKSIFGGTMFTAVDPIHTLLLGQIFYRRGVTKMVTWLKTAKIDYIKPARKNLQFSIKITDEQISYALEQVKQHGKVVQTFDIEIFDKDGLCCARSQNEIYIRDLTFNFNNIQAEQYHIIKSKA